MHEYPDLKVGVSKTEMCRLCIFSKREFVSERDIEFMGRENYRVVCLDTNHGIGL